MTTMSLWHSRLTGALKNSAGNVMLFLLHKHTLLGRVTPSSGGQLRGWDNLKWVSGLGLRSTNMFACSPCSVNL